MKKFIPIALFLLFGSIFASSLMGQVTGGAVTGSVVDSNGAVIPNATVRLADKVRGQVLTSQTTSAGSYLFPNVPVGSYTLTIEQSGFATATKEITVSLNQTTTLDASLQPAGSTNVVDVTSGGEAIVQTDTSQIGKSFELRKVEDLPILGNVNNLAVLAPNVAPQANGTAGSGAVIGGIRPRGNTFSVDGVDNNDASVTGPSAAVIQDAVEEFTLLQNNFNAEFGAGAGGQFNTITKSGTNQFHGRAYTYINSQQFNAHTTGEDGRQKDFFKQAKYGGTFGGPILKNKLFFFGAYERLFLVQPGAVDQYTAPTAAGLDQIAAIPGASPFVVNLLRNNLTLAPSASQTQTVLGVPGIQFGQVVLAIPGNQAGHSFQINIDHTPTDRDQLRYRFGYDRQRVLGPGGGGLKFNNTIAFDSRLFSANWVHTFNSNVINDLRLSYKSAIDSRPLVDPTVTDFPNITVDSLNLALGPNGVLPQGTPDDYNYQVYDAVTVVHGQHTFKVGGEMRRLIFTSSFLPRARGDYEYSTLDNLLRDIKPDVTDIRGIGSPNFVGNRFQWFWFAQDDWKVRPNLTLNLGLRYEFANLPRDAASQELNSIASVPGVIDIHRPKTDTNNYAPRIGFAWSPTSKNGVGKFFFGKQGESSIRANFAMAYFVNFQNLLLLNLPPQFAQENNGGGPNTQFLQSGGIPNVLLPANTPALARNATSSIIVDQVTPYSLSWSLSYQRQLSADMGIEFRYLSTRGYKLPFQKQLNAPTVSASDQILPTLYARPSAGQLTGLPTFLDVVNRPSVGVGALQDVGFGPDVVVTSFPAESRSWYDGASVTLTRRFSRTLGFSASYTFSKTIDTATNELNTSALNPRRAQDGFNLADEKGLSVLDVPHRFVMSFNYDLDFFRKVENPVVRKALDGWQLNGVFQAQSGQPVTIRSGVDSNINFDVAGDRALFNSAGSAGTSSRVCPLDANGNFLAPGGFFGPGTVTTDINQCALGAYGPTNAVAYLVVDPSAQFVQRGFLAAGVTAGRNTFRTKGFNSTDVVIVKNTKFGPDDRFNLQIGAEIFDLFNQRPKTVFGVGAQTAAFGIAGNANFNDYSVGNFTGRFVTMRAKFIF
ncbi:MAG: carboxypeptidase regulatory-like domain-containing protein [Acidobacteriota bacterium]